MENHQCLSCGKPLTGRFDKKFCDTQCRATFHNQHKRKHERIITAVNRQIRKNRTILKNLCPEGKATVRRERLEEMGFSFQYFSSLFLTQKLTYYFSYEYGFAPIEEQSARGEGLIQKVLIIQHQGDMKGQFDPWQSLH